MVLRINIQFKLIHLDSLFSYPNRVRLLDAKSSHHVLNNYDITGKVNKFLENANKYYSRYLFCENCKAKHF